MASTSSIHQESLKDQAQNIHEEARMVLPGVQALFGFQLIAAFNQRFGELDKAATAVFVGSLLVVAIIVGLLMTPAAYHRICERKQVSPYFAAMSSRLIATAMVLLAIAIGADVYVVGRMVTEPWVAVLLGVATMSVLLTLWLAFPLWHNANSHSRRS